MIRTQREKRQELQDLLKKLGELLLVTEERHKERITVLQKIGTRLAEQGLQWEALRAHVLEHEFVRQTGDVTKWAAHFLVLGDYYALLERYDLAITLLEMAAEEDGAIPVQNPFKGAAFSHIDILRDETLERGRHARTMDFDRKAFLQRGAEAVLPAFIHECEKTVCEGLFRFTFLVDPMKDNLLVNCHVEDHGVVIPDELKRIGPFAFKNCPYLRTLQLPKGLEYVDEDCFYDSAMLEPPQRSYWEDEPVSLSPPKLSNIVLRAGMSPAAIEQLGWALHYKPEDKGFSFTVLQTWEDTDEEVLESFAALQESCAVLTGSKLALQSKSANFRCIDGGLYYTDPQGQLGLVALLDRNVEEFQISNEVKIIYGWAFCRCRNLKSVGFPRSLAYVGDGAFWGCSALKGAEEALPKMYDAEGVRSAKKKLSSGENESYISRR